MARSIYIFGNGLGMALSPSSYSLPNVMQSVWKSPTLDMAQKALIAACLPDGAQYPVSEEQLETLQETLGASEILVNVEQSRKVRWLTDVGAKFPDAVYKLLFSVAREMYFATYPKSSVVDNFCRLPDGFSDSLAVAVSRNQSHIATLNYDGLISRALGRRGLFDGKAPQLIDGFDDNKFHRTNLFRKNNIGGWYLHLHGSPLYAERDRSRPYKLSEISLRVVPKSLSNVGQHVVLTHFSHKMGKIESSEILRTYWEFLDLAIEESAKIVLFGYSGNDLHLNRLISQARSNKEVLVVEWLGAGNKPTRTQFWHNQLGGDVSLKLMEDILSFSEW